MVNQRPSGKSSAIQILSVLFSSATRDKGVGIEVYFKRQNTNIIIKFQEKLFINSSKKISTGLIQVSRKMCSNIYLFYI